MPLMIATRILPSPGGVGGQLQTLSVCRSFGGAAVRGQSFFLPCTDGLRQLTLTPDGRVSPGWHAQQQITGSPIIGGQTIYSLDPSGGVLYALDAATGQIRTTLKIGQTSRFATPAFSHSTLFIGTLTGIVAVHGHICCPLRTAYG